MPKVSLFVRLEAKPGKEAEVAAFLRQAGYKPGLHDLIASPLFEGPPTVRERTDR